MNSNIKTIITKIINYIIPCIVIIMMCAFSLYLIIVEGPPHIECETTTITNIEELECSVVFKNIYDDTNYYIGVYFCNEINVIEVTKNQYDIIEVDSKVTVQIINDNLSISAN